MGSADMNKSELFVAQAKIIRKFLADDGPRIESVL